MLRVFGVLALYNVQYNMTSMRKTRVPGTVNCNRVLVLCATVRTLCSASDVKTGILRRTLHYCTGRRFYYDSSTDVRDA